MSSSVKLTSSPPSSPIPLTQHIPFLLFSSLTVLTSTLINRAQSTPYIDEIFHIPQALQFCSALTTSSSSSFSIVELWQRLRNVEYDPKLTTPPGLYAISIGLAKLLPGWECVDTRWLRSTNLLLLLTLPVLVGRILRQNQEAEFSPPSQQQSQPEKTRKPIPKGKIKALQQKAQSELPPTPSSSIHDELDLPIDIPITSSAPTQARPMSKATNLPVGKKRREPKVYTMALVCTISFLSPLWFFGFLYYTDVASVWLVVACLGLYNQLNTSSFPSSPSFSSRRSWVSTWIMLVFASVLAVAVRQTNLVWMMYCAAQSTLSSLYRLELITQQKGLEGELKSVLHAANTKRFWRVVGRNLAPLLPMLFGCAIFINWNGSIVLGDKSNHQAGIHFPQLGYFLLFATMFGLFPLLSTFHSPTSSNALQTVYGSIKTAIHTTLNHAFSTSARSALFTILFSLTWVAVDKYTIDHPFLLADNRHFSFYVWRVFRKPLHWGSVMVEPRFAVVPVYLLALYAWAIAMGRRRKGGLQSLLLAGATAATLIPTPLIEIRYYLIPYLLLRIGVAEEEKGKWVFLALELGVYALVNALTIILFLTRTFEWPPNAVDVTRGEGTKMRFIW